MFETKKDIEKNLIKEIEHYYKIGYSVYDTFIKLDGKADLKFIEKHFLNLSLKQNDIKEDNITILPEVYLPSIKSFNDKIKKIRDLSAIGILRYLYNNKDKVDKTYLGVCRIGLSLSKEFCVDSTVNDVKPNLTKLYINLLAIYKEILDTDYMFNLIQGGRGAGKSIALADLTIAYSFLENFENTNFLCFRQFQVSLQASMHALLKERIYYYSLKDYFTINNTTICNNYSNVVIYFKGMVDPGSLKSLNNISLAIGDEAQQMNGMSIEQVLPSIRRTDGSHSKVILSMNPLKPIDPIVSYVKRQGNNSLIKHVTIFDLPPKYQNKSLLEQANADKKSDIDLFNHKWLGKPNPIYAGTPFTNLLQTPSFEISEPYNAKMYIDPAFSGINDYTAVTILWPGRVGCTFYRYILVYGEVLKLNYREASSIIAKLVLEYNVEIIRYEANGGAHSMGLDLETELNKLKYTKYHIQGIINNKSKVIRINKLIGLVDRFMFIYNEKTKDYIEQIKNYNPDYSTKTNKVDYYDDAPDSLSGACEQFYGI